MIEIRGAREHNLKNIDVNIPHNKLVVITGLSGSGKSSLAFDTLFAEGQRRFVESLSAYARQFLGLMQKPRVEHISGLSPAIAIEQRNRSTGLRSTVGTSTDIYDYLRLLYAHIGIPHCPDCGKPITPQTTEEIINSILDMPEKSRVQILAPVVSGRKGEHKEILEKAKRSGFVRVRINGKIYLIEEAVITDGNKKHSIEIVVDRIIVKPSVKTRLADSVETALRIGNGKIIVSTENLSAENKSAKWKSLQKGDILYSKAFACEHCNSNYEFEQLAPRIFSFNSPYGMCKTCHGLGIDLKHWADMLPCKDCNGARLKPYSRAVTVRGKNIIEFTNLSIDKSYKFIDELNLSNEEEKIVGEVCKEIKSRLKFLIDVGLDYISLSRRSGSLSGGEAQRIRLASQIGTGLTGVLYVLDEPTIGLHMRDNEKLLSTLIRLRDLGNTVVIVEHDAETILKADYLIDLGPGAGVHGGYVIHQGSIKKLLKNKESLTAAYLTGKRGISIPDKRRKPNNKETLVLKGATHNNLKNISVNIPLGLLTCVTGVSGSGKSSLINDTLLPALKREIYSSEIPAGGYKKILGADKIDKVIVVDQAPIGRTPRSNPATYTKVFTHIRNLFAKLPEARARGYSPSRFSFNVKGGRCEACEGKGVKQIEMHFLPDVYVTCDACLGKRFNKETLEITFHGKNIAEVLDMTVEEAYHFFSKVPAIKNILKTLTDVGLEYITLGQHATTLSGGEAQRVKLSNELAKRGTGKTLYILDEPTTGLHFADVDKLLAALQRIVDLGNTVIVIEHNIDVLKCADNIIDLGPEGGDKGGYVIASGSPEEIAETPESFTGKYISCAFSNNNKSADNAA